MSFKQSEYITQRMCKLCDWSIQLFLLLRFYLHSFIWRYHKDILWPIRQWAFRTRGSLYRVPFVNKSWMILKIFYTKAFKRKNGTNKLFLNLNYYKGTNYKQFTIYEIHVSIKHHLRSNQKFIYLLRVNNFSVLRVVPKTQK